MSHWQAGDDPAPIRTAIAAVGLDGPGAVAAFEASLQPVRDGWMAKRLSLLWKSSTPAASLDATAWLHETGRLLRDLPQDILADAIDGAIRASLRGFMPTVGEIRAIADPAVAKRRRELGALRIAVFGPAARPRYAWEPEEREIAPEDRCTPAEARALIARFGIGRNTAAA